MKKIYYIIGATGLLLSSCGEATKESEAATDNAPKETEVLETIETKDLISLDFEGMNLDANPREDFYEFSCGKWLEKNPIPEEESKWSNFNVLNNSNNDILKVLLESAQAAPGDKGEARQLIGDLYNSFSDTLNRNSKDITPILDILDVVNKIENKEDLQAAIANLHNVGIGAGFGVSVEQDLKLNDRYALYMGQGGLGLPNRNYYFDTDERSEKIRKAYKEHVAKMAGLTVNFENEDLQKKSYAIEEQLASKCWTPVELRDMESQYNKMTIAELSSLAPGFDWGTYFTKRGLEIDSIIVGQTEFATEFANMIQDVSIADWKAYLKWNIINATASDLTMDLERANFAFYSTTMRGTKKMKPLWKRGVQMVSGSAVGQGLGEVFVDENFSPSAKVKVNEMVANITLVFEERISNLDWMSAETKVKAKEKLGSFTRKLGFPDEWKSYEGLEISADNFAQNQMNLAAFGIKENFDKLGTDINKKEWHMPPQIVNAYYNPLLNEIVFPAGIMQKPFFSEDFEDAVNYARMGAVIGHELTHGFDDQGSQFDATGAMINWWTKEDKEKFDAKTQLLIDQYNSFEVLEGVFVNGELTLGENIADLGGLTIAYYAFQKSKEGQSADKMINDFSSNQRFFIAFGQVWQNNIRESALVQRVNTDPHSPGKYRVNGVLANMPEFFEAFEVQEGDAMRQSEEKIARIW